MLTGPGDNAFTRIPSLANCTPSSRLIARTPPFDAVYAICDVAAPIVATKDAVLIIDPFLFFCIYGNTALQHRNTEVVFTLNTRSQASMPVIKIESSSGGEIPALLNAISMRL